MIVHKTPACQPSRRSDKLKCKPISHHGSLTLCPYGAVDLWPIVPLGFYWRRASPKPCFAVHAESGVAWHVPILEEPRSSQPCGWAEIFVSRRQPNISHRHPSSSFHSFANLSAALSLADVRHDPLVAAQWAHDRQRGVDDWSRRFERPLRMLPA